MFQFIDIKKGPAYILLCAGILLPSCTEIAHGQTIIDWDSAAGGSYNLAANWNPANVPDTATETARFNLAGTMTVTFPASYSATVDDLLVNAGDVTFSNAGSFNDATINVSDDAILDGGDLTLTRVGGTTADVILNVAGLVQVIGGSTFSFSDGASVSADDLYMGWTSSGDGTMIVDSSSSSLSLTGDVLLGASGNTGTLTFQNDTTGNSIGGELRLIASSGVPDSTGRVNVLSGASLETADIEVGFSTSATAVQEALLTVSGTDSLLEMTGASTFTIGDDINPNIVANVLVSDGGQLDSGTGNILLQNSGHLVIVGGSFNADGMLTMGSGSRLTLNGGELNASAGLDNSAVGTIDHVDGTITVTGGAFVPNPGGSDDDYVIEGVSSSETPHLVISSGSSMNMGDLWVGEVHRGEMTISGGATVSDIVGLIGTGPDATGTVTVTDPGSNWSNIGLLSIGSSGNGTLNVQNGGMVTSSLGILGNNANSIGVATVHGDGSSWILSSDLRVGGNTSAGGTGHLFIEDNGLVDVDGTLKVWDAGTVMINGGRLSFDTEESLDIEPTGTFEFNYGTLILRGDLEVTSGNTLQMVLGGSYTLAVGKTLEVDGATTLNNILKIDGGTFSTGALVNVPLLDFQRGTLNLTNQPVAIEPGGPFGDTLVLEADKLINVTLGVTNRGLVTGNGNLGGPLTNAADGEIQALAGNLLTFTGSGNVNNGQMTLTGGQLHFTQDVTNSATGLVIGNGTLWADGGSTNDGTMAFSATANVIGDLTNNATGQIISAGGTTTFFDDVTNNGEIRTAENSFTVYFGSYSGNGDTGLGTVIMEGDLTPGSSPGIMDFGGSLTFGPAAGLEIEIGGLLAGSQYDQVTVEDSISLDGTLTVELINSFIPSAGDTFDIITASSVADTFLVEGLPDLGGFAWNIRYNETNVVLEVVSLFTADFDNDGDVDDDDLAVWQGAYGANALADADGDGDSDGADFLAWQRQLGQTGVSSTNELASIVPEPAGLLLAGLATPILLASWRRRL